MSAMLNAYTRVLKAHDKDLFCALNDIGIPCVFRRSKRFIPVVESDGFRLMDLIKDRQYVFALTSNWAAHGRVVHWGIDRVLDRVKECDSQVNEQILEDIEREEELEAKAKERHLRNEMEAFWSDQRSRFKEATKDILTHSLDKSEPTKRKKEKFKEL